jgi:hypothetical protein
MVGRLAQTEEGHTATTIAAIYVAQRHLDPRHVNYAIRLPVRACTSTKEERLREYQEQARLLRDVVGNPFRPVTLDPAWLTWNGGTVPRIAEGIYEKRAFDRMAILADALEEAGCTDADILGHCRGPGDHVRGCWLVDALLSKS